MLATLCVSQNSEEFFVTEQLASKYLSLLNFKEEGHNIDELYADIRKNVIRFCGDGIRKLYAVASGETDVYEFSKDMQDTLEKIGDEFVAYKSLVKENCVFILLKILAKYFEYLPLEELKQLTSFVPYSTVRKAIMLSGPDSQLGMKINTASNVLEFFRNGQTVGSIVSDYQQRCSAVETIALKTRL